jgi:ribosomal protein S18 acetylase RimI-like enzyme
MAESQTIHEIAHGSDHYRATVDLRYLVLRQPLGLAFTPEELDAEKDSRHLACYRLDKLAGCLVLLPRGDREFQMRQLAVSPELQRKGVGKALVEYSEMFARNIGYRRIFLHARETAVPFYERLAYSKLGDRFIEVTLPHWEMAKSLTRP